MATNEGKSAAGDEGGRSLRASAISFNQDQECLACGTSAGFRIFNCDPFSETIRRDFEEGGFPIVEMLYRCNIVALVGSNNPRFPPTKCMLWDDHERKCIGELAFRSDVKGVRLRRDRITVVLEQRVYVYNFADLSLLHQIDTLANKSGLCAVSCEPKPLVLACPGIHKGQVRVERYEVNKTRFIAAHEGNLACLAMSADGSKIATASEKGTIVRVFDTNEGSQLFELRRGTDHALVHSLSFSPACEWLAATSDKGTAHVFSLTAKPQGQAGGSGVQQAGAGAPGGVQDGAAGPAGGQGDPGRPVSAGQGRPQSGKGAVKLAQSSVKFVRGYLPKYLPTYFSSTWSHAQFRLPDGAGRSIAAFGQAPNTFMVAAVDGSFYRCSFDPAAGGVATQLSFTRFLKPDEEEDNDEA